MFASCSHIPCTHSLSLYLNISQVILPSIIIHTVLLSHKRLFIIFLATRLVDVSHTLFLFQLNVEFQVEKQNGQVGQYLPNEVGCC